MMEVYSHCQQQHAVHSRAEVRPDMSIRPYNRMQQPAAGMRANFVVCAESKVEGLWINAAGAGPPNQPPWVPAGGRTWLPAQPTLPSMQGKRSLGCPNLGRRSATLITKFSTLSTAPLITASATGRTLSMLVQISCWPEQGLVADGEEGRDQQQGRWETEIARAVPGAG